MSGNVVMFPSKQLPATPPKGDKPPTEVWTPWTVTPPNYPGNRKGESAS